MEKKGERGGKQTEGEEERWREEYERRGGLKEWNLEDRKEKKR